MVCGGKHPGQSPRGSGAGRPMAVPGHLKAASRADGSIAGGAGGTPLLLVLVLPPPPLALACAAFAAAATAADTAARILASMNCQAGTAGSKRDSHTGAHIMSATAPHHQTIYVKEHRRKVMRKQGGGLQGGMDRRTPELRRWRERARGGLGGWVGRAVRGSCQLAPCSSTCRRYGSDHQQQGSCPFVPSPYPRNTLSPPRACPYPPPFLYKRSRPRV